MKAKLQKLNEFIYGRVVVAEENQRKSLFKIWTECGIEFKNNEYLAPDEYYKDYVYKVGIFQDLAYIREKVIDIIKQLESEE